MTIYSLNILLFYLEPVCCSMSSSNYCFLTCIQVSQGTGQVVWYSHLFQNFPQFIVIHTVKRYGIVNNAKIDVFLELSCFFDDPADVRNLISDSSAFSKTSLSSWSSQFKYCWILAWRILSITLLVCETSAIVRQFPHSWALPFFEIGMKTDLFQYCGYCWVFQICWHIECSTFTASSFRIWNSSAGIPSHPLALFVVVLSQAHLTLHSRMSGSRWVITPSWLSGSWRSYLYSSSVYSCLLFLISSASVRSISFLSFIEPIFAWNIPSVSLIFLKRSLVFPILLLSSISLHWLLRKAFLSLLALLWNSAFKWVYLSFSLCFLLPIFSQLFVRPPQTATLLFFISFSWGWSWFLSPVQCHESPSIVHQALCLSDLVP